MVVRTMGTLCSSHAQQTAKKADLGEEKGEEAATEEDSEDEEFKTIITTNFKEGFSPQFFTFDNKNIIGSSNLGSLFHKNLDRRKASNMRNTVGHPFFLPPNTYNVWLSW